MKNKSSILFAPHCDDEIIGCWSALNAGLIDTVYFASHDAVRRKEAELSSQVFGFKAVFKKPTLEELGEFKVAYLPAITDTHPDHKKLNRKWRLTCLKLGIKVKYYSVDLQDCASKTLVKNHQSKLAALNKIYPSQSSLWQTDASYYLFECIRDADFKTEDVTEVLVDSIKVKVTHTPKCVFNTMFDSPESLCNTLIAKGCDSFSFDFSDKRYSL